MKSMKYTLVVACTVAAVLLLCSFPAVAATDPDAIREMTYKSATVATAVAGVHTFAAAPKGFDPINASDLDLASFGYPIRPDVSDPRYKTWVRAVSHMKHQPDPMKIKEMPFSSASMRPGKGAPGASASISAGQTTVTSSNWSGVAAVNALTSYNKSKSFYFVISDLGSPVAEEALNTSGLSNGYVESFICDNLYDIEVSWNGIDGFNSGDVIQGGTLSEAWCFDDYANVGQYYTDWIEWYPSYSIISVFNPYEYTYAFDSSSESYFNNPGDEVFVESVNFGGTNTQEVCVIDETFDYGGCYTLAYASGPGAIGNSAEWIVERPCCENSDLYPLANYVSTYNLSAAAYDYGKKTDPLKAYPGGSSSATQTYYNIEMENDQGSEVISYVDAGEVDGRYSIAFFDTGCAYAYGCTQ
jgi:hypothetical protein